VWPNGASGGPVMIRAAVGAAAGADATVGEVPVAAGAVGADGGEGAGGDVAGGTEDGGVVDVEEGVVFGPTVTSARSAVPAEVVAPLRILARMALTSNGAAPPPVW